MSSAGPVFNIGSSVPGLDPVSVLGAGLQIDSKATELSADLRFMRGGLLQIARGFVTTPLAASLPENYLWQYLGIGNLAVGVQLIDGVIRQGASPGRLDADRFATMALPPTTRNRSKSTDNGLGASVAVRYPYSFPGTKEDALPHLGYFTHLTQTPGGLTVYSKLAKTSGIKPKSIYRSVSLIAAQATVNLPEKQQERFWSGPLLRILGAALASVTLSSFIAATADPESPSSVDFIKINAEVAGRLAQAGLLPAAAAIAIA